MAVPPGSPPPLPKDPKDHPANVPSARAASSAPTTADLEELADWLTTCGVTSIAMESTGIYHIALVRAFGTAWLRDLSGGSASDQARARSPQDGRTRLSMDPKIAQLRPVCRRPFVRPTRSWCCAATHSASGRCCSATVANTSSTCRRPQEQMNVKLGVVVSDVTGVTGMAIIKAILMRRTRSSRSWPSCVMRSASTAKPKLPAAPLWHLAGGTPVRTQASGCPVRVLPGAAARMRSGTGARLRPSKTRAAAKSCRRGC